MIKRLMLSESAAAYWKYPVLLTWMWFVAILIVRPIGEFPINDDWAYSKNVYNLTENGKFVVDTWPAMNLISQTLYGSIFTSVFGFSYTLLRFSILLLALVATIVVFRIVAILSVNNGFLAFVVAGCFCFNVLFFPLAFTFMTDVFFMSFMIFAIYQSLQYTRTGSYVSYTGFIFFCVVAVLNRQHGLILPLLITGAVIDREKLSLKSIIMMATPIVLVWLAHDKYRHYLTANGIANGLQNIEHLTAYLETTPFSTHVLRLAVMLLDLGRLLFPFVSLFLILKWKELSWKDGIVFTGIMIVVCSITYKGWDLFPSCNVANIVSTGPHLLKFDDPAQESARYTFLRVILLISAVLGLTGTGFLLQKKSFYRLTGTNARFLRISIYITLCGLLSFIVLNKSYFDRYTLLPAFLIVLLLISDHPVIPVRGIITGMVLLAGTYGLNLIKETDFFNWQKARWKAIDYLHRKGVTAADMDGGFEYHGWYKPTEEYPDDGRSWWWVKRDTYLVTTKKEVDGYVQDTVFRYQNILPYKTKRIFVLQRRKQ